MCQERPHKNFWLLFKQAWHTSWYHIEVLFYVIFKAMIYSAGYIQFFHLICKRLNIHPVSCIFILSMRKAFCMQDILQLLQNKLSTALTKTIYQEKTAIAKNHGNFWNILCPKIHHPSDQTKARGTVSHHNTILHILTEFQQNYHSCDIYSYWDHPCIY